MTSNQTIGGLAEIALRVNDLETMTEFYQTVIGLKLMSRSEKMVFFRIAEGFAGHTQVLALFDRRPVGDQESSDYSAPESIKSTVDHLAFSIASNDFEVELNRLRNLGFSVREAYHDWVKWRSLYLTDPEGNLVELVCFDPQQESMSQ